MPSFLARRAVVLLVSIALVLPGCTGPSPSSTTGGAGSGGASAPDDQCEAIVASVHETFHLARLGRTTEVGDGVARVNDWGRSCNSGALRSVRLPEKAAALLSDSQRQNLSESHFSLRDGEHLRDCVLIRAVSKYAAGPEDPDRTELDRVVTTFRHVIRAIGLIDQHPEGLHLTPYEVYLRGKGTAADRAWIFASLLREKKFDAVLLHPAADRLEDAFLVGVPLDGEVYLFDPRLGIPLPAPGDTAVSVNTTKPATLAQAAGDSQVLRQLDVEGKFTYPLRAEDLQQPAVELIADTSWWTARMHALQSIFLGDDAMRVADPLDDTADGPGLWSRVVQAGAGRWTEENLRLWAYSEEQMAAHAAMDRAAQESLLKVLLPFNAYVNLVVNSKGEIEAIDNEKVKDAASGEHDPMQRIVQRKTVGAQKKARLQQIDGDLVAAIPNYTDVRQRCRIVADKSPDAAIKAMHLAAMDDADYWTALCKFDQGEYDIARDALDRYRRQHKRGAWRRESRYLLAQTYAALKDFPAAIGELDAVKPNDPEYGGYRWLIRTWGARPAQSQPKTDTE